MLIALRRILIVTALFAGRLSAGDLALAVDDLPAPDAVAPSKKAPPLEVRLLGYVQGPNPDSMSALVKIEDETFTLKKGEKMQMFFEHAREVTVVEFKEFDPRKREIRLGFPGTSYAAQEYTMKRAVRQKTP